jgi:nicotinamide-nucleotide amidase
MIEADEKRLRCLLSEYVYGSDGQSLAEVVGKLLKQAGKTISVAESCTGGMLAKMLTDVPGSSAYFLQGWVTYSNQAKIRELGVAKHLLREHGAVSAEVAAAMAQGARTRACSDFGVGITGVAGPEGGSEQKPVGLVYISVDWDGGSETRQSRFVADRNTVRVRASLTALDMVRGQLRFD